MYNISKIFKEVIMKTKNENDVFHAYLVKEAFYDGIYEMPRIKPTNELPKNLISFSRAKGTNDFNRWMHFYEYDYKIEKIWNNSRKYLSMLQKYNYSRFQPVS